MGPLVAARGLCSGEQCPFFGCAYDYDGWVRLKSCSSQQLLPQLRIAQLFFQHCRRISVPDSRVTVPIEDFAQTMRSLFPRYSSASDERLIDIFASENPQCRLLREGANVSLENLSSILTTEAERQAEGATPGAEPTPEAGSASVVANELMESAESQQGGEDSGETIIPGGPVSESPGRSDADDGRPGIPKFGLEEEKKRPVALWVACIVGVLALGGTGIYYAQHAKVENQNNTPSSAAAPVKAPPVADANVADANTPVPESAPNVQEPQAEAVTAAPPVALKTDTDNSVPAFGVDQLFQRIHAPHGDQDFVGKRIRIKGKIETLGKDDVSFLGSESPLSYWFDVHGIGDKELSSYKTGDAVEVVCEFTGNRASIGDNVMRWSFHGVKIRKVSP
jgi:hypothetical protein